MTLRILMAEDSEIFAHALGQLIRQEPDLELLEIARDGQEAITLCQQLKPDLVVMDIQMPKLDGLSATEHIMATCPTPILVVTSDPFRGGVDQSFRALNAGALDLIAKPNLVALSGGLDEPSQREFLQKIRLLADIPVVRHVRGRRRANTAAITSPQTPKSLEALRSSAPTRQPTAHPQLLGIVASTGGPKILARLFEELPQHDNLAILIVQHITDGFSAHLARWLDNHSSWHIKVGQAHEPILGGHVYLAPSKLHMELSPRYTIQLRDEGPIFGHCPNGDLLLESIAKHAKGRPMGLILSGMGRDGAQGLNDIANHKGLTFAQDPSSCVVPGMPRAALELGCVDEIVTPDEMAATILRRTLYERLR